MKQIKARKDKKVAKEEERVGASTYATKTGCNNNKAFFTYPGLPFLS